MEIKVINVARDFSRYPAGRYLEDGPHSGQAFRENHLRPVLNSDAEKIVVELDGARGYGSSFLEEAFGGLVRSGFEASDLLKRLDLKSSDASLVEEIKNYIQESAQFGGQS
jgi:hypothetical protein